VRWPWTWRGSRAKATHGDVEQARIAVTNGMYAIEQRLQERLEKQHAELVGKVDHIDDQLVMLDWVSVNKRLCEIERVLREIRCRQEPMGVEGVIENTGKRKAPRKKAGRRK